MPILSILPIGGAREAGRSPDAGQAFEGQSYLLDLVCPMIEAQVCKSSAIVKDGGFGAESDL